MKPGRVRYYRELAAWLLPIALGTNYGPVLVGALFDELRDGKAQAPALSTIERLAWQTRRRAQRLVFVRLIAALTDAQCARLDALLVVPPGARITPLASLRQPFQSAHARHVPGADQAHSGDPRHRTQP